MSEDLPSALLYEPLAKKWEKCELERAKTERWILYSYSALQKENHRENIRVYIKSDSVSRVESVFSFAPSALALAARIPPPAHLPFWHWRRRLWVLARGMVQPVAAQTQTKACGVLSHTHKQIFTCHPSYTHFLNCDCASAPTLCRSRVAIIITWRPLIFLLERRGGDVIKIAIN